MIKGYKGFNKDLTCRNFQYEIGKTYETGKKPVICTKNGFHFCEDPLDVFNYYPPNTSRYCEVEGDGEIDREDGEDSKVAVSKIKIGAEIELYDLIQSAVKFRFEKVDWSKAEHIATGGQGAANATGDQGAASATGERGAASATGYQGVASATGYLGAANATGERGAASATGDQGVASATGYLGAANATGNRGVASAAGYQGAASAEGEESVAMAVGISSRAKGSLGCWIVLAEWVERDNHWHRKDVQCTFVDGVTIKADTWYRLVDGEFVES